MPTILMEESHARSDSTTGDPQDFAITSKSHRPQHQPRCLGQDQSIMIGDFLEGVWPYLLVPALLIFVARSGGDFAKITRTTLIIDSQPSHSMATARAHPALRRYGHAWSLAVAVNRGRRLPNQSPP